MAKLKICSVCKKPCLLWKSKPPLCKDCAGKAKAQEQGENGISRIQKPLTEEQKEHKASINKMFSEQADKIPACCMECNKPLTAVTDWAKRCVTAHILPKAEFPEIADDPLNIFFLGAIIIGVCSCHDNYDRKGIEFRSQMSIYTLAVQRFHLLKGKLTNRNFMKACKYLKIDYTTISRY